MIFADPPRTDAPTAVMTETCFRQVEFAGVLRGTEHPEAAGQLVDFLAGPAFQAEVALNLFVWPARTDVAPPAEFTQFSAVVDDPLTVPPADITEHREAVDRRVDRDRGAVTTPTQPGLGRPWWLVPALAFVPAVFLATFYAWPVVTLFAEVTNVADIGDTLGRPGLGSGDLVHLLAGRDQHGRDAGHRTGADVPRVAMAVRRTAAA